MVKYRFTIGQTTEKVLEKQLPETYVMELTSNDYELFAKLVNIGIDGRLQAIFADNLEQIGNRAKISLNKSSMVCLLNRLLDYSDLGTMADNNLLDYDQKQESYNLRSDILSTIDIEEI